MQEFLQLRLTNCHSEVSAEIFFVDSFARVGPALFRKIKKRVLVEGEISAEKGREQVSTCDTKIRFRVFCAFGQILVGECLPQTLL